MSAVRSTVGVLLFCTMYACGTDAADSPSLRTVEQMEDIGWKALSTRPSPEELRCAREMLDFWTVSLSNGVLEVVPRTVERTDDPLPFDPPSGRDRIGRRHVLRVSDGWLVGFDAGEFGGGLWWFGPEGEEAYRLHPPSETVANDEGRARVENVRGFAQLEGKVVVLIGLDHLLGSQGRAFRVYRAADRWTLLPLAVFDASPRSWVAAEGRLFLVMQDGLWALDPEGQLESVHATDLTGLAPSSLVHTPERVFYIGLRHYVLRLAPVEGRMTETWFAPSACAHFRTDADCECLPAEE